LQFCLVYVIIRSSIKNRERGQEYMVSGRQKTQEEFEKGIEDIWGGKIKVLGKYQKASIKLPVLHTECGNIWEAKPRSLLSNHGCPNCRYKSSANKLKKSDTEFLKQVHDLTKDEYIFNETYKNNDTPMQCTHTVCGRDFKVRPRQFFSGSRCPMCFLDSIRATDEDFTNRVIGAVGEEYVFNEPYVHVDHKILCTHMVCKHQWKVAPSHFLGKGTRCPQCKETKGEREVRLFLEDNNIPYEKEYRFKGLVNQDTNYDLRVDFFVEDHNLVIEYDGIQHYEPVEIFGGENTFLRCVESDKIKDSYFNKKGIELLRIPYWDIENIRDILNKALATKEEN